MHHEVGTELFTTKGICMSIIVVNDLLLIGDDLGFAYLYNCTLKKLEFEIQAHKGAVRGIVYSNTDSIITGGADSSICI